MAAASQETTLGDVIRVIAETRKTGTLTVQTAEVLSYLYFRDGQIQQLIFADGTSMLTQGLQRYPNLDTATCTALEERQKITGDSLLKVILSDKVNGRNFASTLCNFQIRETVVELVNYPDPIFEFIDEETPPAFFDHELFQLALMVDPMKLLAEAEYRRPAWQRIHQMVPSRLDIACISPGCKVETCSKEEQTLISLIDGIRDIGEILAVIRLSSFLALQALCSLLTKGYASLKDGNQLQELTSRPSVINNPEKCIKLFERAEQLGCSNIETVKWLAETYEIMGMPDKAAVKYRKLGEICLREIALSAAIDAFSKAVQLCPTDSQSLARLEQLKASGISTPLHGTQITESHDGDRLANYLSTGNGDTAAPEQAGLVSAEDSRLIEAAAVEAQSELASVETAEIIEAATLENHGELENVETAEVIEATPETGQLKLENVETAEVIEAAPEIEQAGVGPVETAEVIETPHTSTPAKLSSATAAPISEVLPNTEQAASVTTAPTPATSTFNLDSGASLADNLPNSQTSWDEAKKPRPQSTTDSRAATPLASCAQSAALLEQAQSLHQAGKSQEALQAYEQLAQFHLNNKAYEQVLAVYDQALGYYPQAIAMHLARASVLNALERPAEALQAYHQTARYLHEHQLFKEPAGRDFLLLATRRILQKEPANIDARIWLSDLYKTWGDDEKYAQLLEEVNVLIDPEKNPEQYLQSLEKLTTVEPDRLEYLEAMVETCLKLKKLSQAAEVLAKWSEQAVRGQIDAVVNGYGRLIELDPLNATIRRQRADLLIRQGQREQAVMELKLAGYLCWYTGQLQEALTIFKKILSTDQHNELAIHVEIAKIHQSCGDEDKALYHLQKFAEKSALRGNLWDAIAACERILENAPGDVWATAAHKKVQNMLDRYVTGARRKSEGTRQTGTATLSEKQTPSAQDKKSDTSANVKERQKPKPKSALKEQTLKGLSDVFDKIARNADQKPQ